MSGNFSVVIKLSRRREGIIPEKFFRVYGIRNVKNLHKELVKTIELDDVSIREKIPPYLDTYRLCNYYGRKIDKEEFQNLSGNLVHSWYNRREDYEYQEYIVKNE